MMFIDFPIEPPISSGFPIANAMFDDRNGIPIRCVISPDFPTFPDVRRFLDTLEEEPLEITATTAGTAEVTEVQDRSMLKFENHYGTIWNPKNCNFLVEFFRHNLRVKFCRWNFWQKKDTT